MEPLLIFAIVPLAALCISWTTHRNMTQDEALNEDTELYIINQKKFRELFDSADLEPIKFHKGSFIGKESYIHASRIRINNVGYQISFWSWLSHLWWFQFTAKKLSDGGVAKKIPTKWVE